MRKFAGSIVAGAALCIAGSGAGLAADLPARAPVKAPAYRAPVYAPYNWTGLYAGINFGGGFGRSHWSVGDNTINTAGPVVGATLGYNLQNGPWVWGVEGDLDWARIKQTGGCGYLCYTKTDWLGTARVRAGYAFDRYLPYLTGGLAVGNIEASGSGTPGVNPTKAGWTVGGGLEVALIGNWTAKLEYLYVDLGSTNCAAGTCISTATDVDHRISVIRSGVNYRF